MKLLARSLPSAPDPRLTSPGEMSEAERRVEMLERRARILQERNRSDRGERSAPRR